jgi:TRAP-type C4-dicarboxylate transport system permease small subunit
MNLRRNLAIVSAVVALLFAASFSWVGYDLAIVHGVWRRELPALVLVIIMGGIGVSTFIAFAIALWRYDDEQ